jgi:L-fuconolactonase
MKSRWIDAHQHLWRYHPPGASWMGDDMEGLRRDFLLEDLRTVTAGTGITHTIVVEAERSAAETEWLSRVAASDGLICGVVGWAPLTHSTIAQKLEKLASLPKLKGIRHPIHDEPDDQFVLREDFNRGIAALKEFHLCYDILIYEKHLPQTIHFVDRHPNQVFVLDHIAKPRIRDRALSPWRENIRELARRQNVYCKISGMVTEADWGKWSEKDLSPYLETVLEAFTPRRLMFGSDWPVLLLASSYQAWVTTVRNSLARLSAAEQERIFSETAMEAYGFRLP